MHTIRPREPATSSSTLSSRQLGTVIAYGLAAWLLAAMTIRWMPEAFDGGTATVVMFVGGATLGWPFTIVLERSAGLQADQRITAVALASAAAMLADGIGLVWSPLYAAAGSAPVAGAAWLLWDVAWLIIIAAVKR